jgi:hypothetical protein
VFADRKRPDARPGAGTGIPLLKKFARDGSFKFDHGITGEQFSAKVSFDRALIISPNIIKN